MSPSLPPNPSRRRVLTAIGGLGGLGILTIAGCGGGSEATASRPRAGAGSTGTTPTTGASPRTTPVTAAASCTQVPQETAGPFPGDGSNGPNVLAQSGVVRSDIRSSIGSASGTASGLPFTVKLTVLDLKNGCTPLSGAAIYAWHCDREGRYSMYSPGVTNENWLRGVQPTDTTGGATFLTVFPGAYPGRWPHIHFEVYPSIAAATSASGKLTTSQLALPDAACDQVYAAAGYSASAINFPRTSLTGDTVFRDGVSQQLATVTGSPASGMASNLTIAV